MCSILNFMIYIFYIFVGTLESDVCQVIYSSDFRMKSLHCFFPTSICALLLLYQRHLKTIRSISSKLLKGVSVQALKLKVNNYSLQKTDFELSESTAVVV